MSKSLALLLMGTALVVEAVPAAAAEGEPSADAAANDAANSSGQHAQDDHNVIVVYGRSEKKIGIAAAASEGAVAGADIEVRPLLRPGELLEATPGLIATQHSGGGKANQYFLRGFNLDHGTDFALSIDGMPMNFRTHGHGQGYLDVNGLIPEVVERVDYRKGPYHADTGDFGFVGSAFITTRDKIDPFALAEVGQYGYRRFVGGGSAPVGMGELAIAAQAKLNNGPWQLPEDYHGYSGFVKYSVPVGKGEFEVSLNLFYATWQPTEQIPERAIGTLLSDHYATLDPFLHGHTEREILTANYVDDDWKLNFWAQHYDWSLLSNFTFYLDDPVNGDEVRQYDKMWSYGGRAERKLALADMLELKLGTEMREDAIDPVGLDHTIQGAFDYEKTAFSVKESSAGLYAEATWRPLMGLMVVGGLRGDFYRFRTTDLGGAIGWSGLVNAQLVTPKFGLNYELAAGIALYANWGQGFHSNDARGVTNPTSPAPGLVRGNFKELGFRFERGGLILSGDYWWSYIGSELIYVGDSGAVEPSGPGRRHGYEITAFWKHDWLAVDGVWTGSTSRYADLPEGANFVPGALESSGELGISAIFPHWNTALRFRYLGPHPLIEDNSQRGEPTLLVNWRIAFEPKFLPGWELNAELLNALGSNAHDIDYYYVTRLPGEPPEGIEGINSRVVEPRQFRVGIKKTF